MCRDQNALCLAGKVGMQDFTSSFSGSDKIIMPLSTQLLLILQPFLLTVNQELLSVDSAALPPAPPSLSSFTFSWPPESLGAGVRHCLNLVIPLLKPSK